MSDGKKIWEDIAATEAYFGVSTLDKFLAGGLDDQAKKEFFESGRKHIDLVFAELEAALGVIGRPKKALDYGCGVGRLLIPLAERCDSVVGVDISAGMLKEAKKNLDAESVSCDLQNAEQFMADDDAIYDLVHSYIVLQHIEPAIGYRIIKKLLRRLRPGGMGMLHITHTDKSALFTRVRTRIYRDVPLIHGFSAKLRGETRPFIPMYSYDMGQVAAIMEEHRCRKLRSIETDHGYLGEMIFFVRE